MTEWDGERCVCEASNSPCYSLQAITSCRVLKSLIGSRVVLSSFKVVDHLKVKSKGRSNGEI